MPRPTLKTFFSGSDIERTTELRTNSDELRATLAHDSTRFVAIWQSRCLIRNDRAVLLEASALHMQPQLEECVYLGARDGQQIFALELPDTLRSGDPTEEAFDNFGMLLGNLPPADAATLAYAKGVLEWRKRHLHCGKCGAPNLATDGGFVMLCSDANCGTRNFPRLDPAIIVLATRDEHALLGRQPSWPEGRYSTIAGFVEPGESLEDAVAREVFEESNIRVTEPRYLGSQPWPFPNAIMLGFHATATSADIRLNDGELADARWFTREQLAAGEAALPPVQSIAFQLIEAWFDQWEGAPLRSFDLSTDFRRKQ